MKNYIDKDNKVYSYDDGISKEILDAKIKELGLTSISDKDLAILRLPTEEQLKQQEISEAKEYLASTDWYFARLAETGEEVPSEVLIKRGESRDFLNGVGV